MLDCIKEAVTMKTAIIFAIVCLAFANAQFGFGGHFEGHGHGQEGGLSGMMHGGFGQGQLRIISFELVI